MRTKVPDFCFSFAGVATELALGLLFTVLQRDLGNSIKYSENLLLLMQ